MIEFNEECKNDIDNLAREVQKRLEEDNIGESDTAKAITIIECISKLKLLKSDNPDFTKENLFRRTAEEIIGSGELAGNGCADICTIFCSVAPIIGIKVNRVLITADFATRKPHTLIEIINTKTNAAVVIDPKWMTHPKFKNTAEKEEWKTKGLSKIAVDGFPNMTAYNRPAPSGEKREWVVVDSLSHLPDNEYSLDKRQERIQAFFDFHRK